MNKLIILFFVILSCIACSAGGETAPPAAGGASGLGGAGGVGGAADVPSTPKYLPIRIDPAFSSDEAEAIAGAAEEWFEYVPSARVEVSVGTPATIVRRPGEKRAAHGGLILGLSSTNTTSLFPDSIALSGVPFVAVARHELGHFLGMRGHIDDRTALMAALPGSLEITDADVAALCEARGDC